MSKIHIYIQKQEMGGILGKKKKEEKEQRTILYFLFYLSLLLREVFFKSAKENISVVVFLIENNGSY